MGSISGRVKINSGESIDYVIDEDVFDLSSLSESHLQTLVNILREREWNSISERVFGCLVLSILKYCNISRKQIDHVLRILNSILKLNQE